jgi:hypothetical protein
LPDPPATGGDTTTQQGPTYYADVAPILGRYCVSCHSPGQLAPFPLTSYDEVIAHADEVAASVESREMPPFAPKTEGCRPIDDPRNMPVADRQTLMVWASGAHRPGDAASAAPIPKPDDPLGPPDATIDSGFDYLAAKQVTDDYRCFAIDPHFTDVFPLIAASVRSSTPSVVHHVMIYSQPAADSPTIDALDAADPGPGYDCSGGIEINGGLELMVGGVGAPPRRFAPDASVQLAPGTRFVVQVHSSYTNGYRPNHIALELWRAKTAQPDVPNLIPLIDNSFVIPAGAPSVTATETRKVETPGRLQTIFPHMHQLGKSFHAEVIHPDGSQECLIDIDGNWEFHWQQTYQLATAVDLGADDQLSITCEWDNSAAHQPVVDGQQQMPVEVRYGNRASDEMCIGYMMMTNAGVAEN